MKISIPENSDIINFAEVVDVRDGLNASLRKTFFALETMLSDKRFSNSARVLKDLADNIGSDFEEIYNALIDTILPRCELPFIIGLGNFGFPPAHPDFSEIMLSDFGKIIIGRAMKGDFNLPFSVPIPYTFACGTIGYCRSKTKIPSHNIGEVIDAMIALVKNPKLETKDLLQFIKGPDLLIGGAITNPEELSAIYERGFGVISIIVSPKNFDMSFVDRIKDYCDWYGLECRRVYKKTAYKIELPYYAFMSDGRECKLLSLKEILQGHLTYYRNYKRELSDDALCKMLTKLKEQSSERKTYECFE